MGFHHGNQESKPLVLAFDQVLKNEGEEKVFMCGGQTIVVNIKNINYDYVVPGSNIDRMMYSPELLARVLSRPVILINRSDLKNGKASRVLVIGQKSQVDEKFQQMIV